MAEPRTVSELGEFGLIARLTEELGDQARARRAQGKASRLILGIGDDAAVWTSGGPGQIATTDTLVEGVHFPRGRVPWRDLGWKALAINVSDVAAMGGTSEYALITLALPDDFLVEDVVELYRGLAAAGAEYAVVVAGGDVVRAPQAVITVALTGHVALDARGQPLLLTRGGARAGDSVAVTGNLGDSAGGLRLLLEGAADTESARRLIEAHTRPKPPVAVGPAGVEAGLRCAIDVSDGLAQDLGHVCEASGLGAVVQAAALPISAALTETFPDDALALAAAGGEDYELVLVGPPDALERVRRRIDVPLTVIGEMVEDAEGRVRFLDEAGRELALARAGWDHFSGPGGGSSR
jgi:thiamine-monophosphate kinase